jgi:hypothetical protein
LRITIYSNIFIFMTVTNNIYQKQIKYHVFNVVTNSELTELVLVFTTRPAFPTSIKKVNTSFKNVWRTWGPALPTLLANLTIFWPLGLTGPMNFKIYPKKWLYNVHCVHVPASHNLIKDTCTCNSFRWVLDSSLLIKTHHFIQTI